jgi:hypothetical protein
MTETEFNEKPYAFPLMLGMLAAVLAAPFLFVLLATA